VVQVAQLVQLVADLVRPDLRLELRRLLLANCLAALQMLGPSGGQALVPVGARLELVGGAGQVLLVGRQVARLLALRMEHEGGHLLLEVLLLLFKLVELVEVLKLLEMLRVLQVRLLQTSVLLAAHEQRAVLGRGVQLHACG